MKPGLYTADHFVQRSKDVKDANAANTNYTYIQEFFYSNLTKVDSLEYCVVWYDLKHILMIRELPSAENVDPQVKLGPSNHDLLEDFAKIPLWIVLEHKADTNFYCSKHDQQIRNIFYALVFISMSIKLLDHSHLYWDLV